MPCEQPDFRTSRRRRCDDIWLPDGASLRIHSVFCHSAKDQKHRGRQQTLREHQHPQRGWPCTMHGRLEYRLAPVRPSLLLKRLPFFRAEWRALMPRRYMAALVRPYSAFRGYDSAPDHRNSPGWAASEVSHPEVVPYRKRPVPTSRQRRLEKQPHSRI